jgi:hypothetical protein
MRSWRRGPYLWTFQTMHTDYDPAANQTTRLLRYDKWQDGTLRKTELQTLRLQRWNIDEFENPLAQAGFTGISRLRQRPHSRTRRPRPDLPRYLSTGKTSWRPALAGSANPAHTIREAQFRSSRSPT